MNEWRKSSHSGGGSGNCVEVCWRKSSYSNGGGGECVEIAFGVRAVGVRDSKNVAGPTISVSPEAWRSFVAVAAH